MRSAPDPGIRCLARSRRGCQFAWTHRSRLAWTISLSAVRTPFADRRRRSFRASGKLPDAVQPDRAGRAAEGAVLRDAAVPRRAFAVIYDRGGNRSVRSGGRSGGRQAWRRGKRSPARSRRSAETIPRSPTASCAPIRAGARRCGARGIRDANACTRSPGRRDISICRATMTGRIVRVTPYSRAPARTTTRTRWKAWRRTSTSPPAR